MTNLQTAHRPFYVPHLKTIAKEMFIYLTNTSPNFINDMLTIRDQPYNLRGWSTNNATVCN